MTFLNMIARAGAALAITCSTGPALAGEGFAVDVAEDGVVEAARQCDVYVTGLARTTRPDPLRYRWVEGRTELASWTGVRADGTAPLELCGLPVGTHTLTLEVTDGQRTVADTMTATIVSAPALVARGDDRDEAP